MFWFWSVKEASKQMALDGKESYGFYCVSWLGEREEGRSKKVEIGSRCYQSRAETVWAGFYLQ